MNNTLNENIEARFLLNRASANTETFTLDVHVSLPGKGITAIFGESGSGKTTLLRCIAGLEQSKEGSLIVNGDTWQSSTAFVPTYKRPIGYVFQEASLFHHLTAKGNLEYAVKRADKTVSSELYDRVISVMGIEAVLPQKPEQLSGGERQRIAIARALLVQPRVLLMDEPLASLDTRRKQEILPYLEKLRSHFDVPIFYVSHAVDEVARLGDHAIVLDQGRIVAQGDVNSVFSRIDLPVLFGEDIGVVINGRITERDAEWNLMRISFSGGELWVRDDGDAVGSQTRVRVLAKDISLSLSAHEDTSILNRISARVVEISEDSDKSVLLTRLKSGNDYLIARITKKSAHHLKIQPGMDLWAQVKSAALVR